MICLHVTTLIVNNFEVLPGIVEASKSGFELILGCFRRKISRPLLGLVCIFSGFRNTSTSSARENKKKWNKYSCLCIQPNDDCKFFEAFKLLSAVLHGM